MNNTPPEPRDEDRVKELNSIKPEDEHYLMDEFLMHQPPEVRRRVRQTVETWGIKKNDPYFLILIQCGINQILYELTPNKISQSFDNSFKELVGMLEKYKGDLRKVQSEQLEQHQQAALDLSLAKLNTAIANVMEDNNLNYEKAKFSPRVLGSMVTAVAIAICSSGSFWVGSVVTSYLNPRQQIARNAEDTALLKWAKSSEGEFAKKLIDWNDDLISQECQKKVQSLGITFRQGASEQTNGFCVVMTVPSGQRKYRQVNK